MGSSAYPVVGRLRRDHPFPFTGDLMAMMASGLYRPQDFEFLDPDKDEPLINGNFAVHLHSNYPLFSWLADIRGTTAPIEGYLQNKVDSEAFCDWLSKGFPKYLDGTWNPIDPKEDFNERYVVGWRGPHIRTIDWLLNFNYDTVAHLQHGFDDDEVVFNETTCCFEYVGPGVPHPEGRTYRDIFTFAEGSVNCPVDEYFQYLKAAKAEDWDFIIFLFD